MKTKIFDALKQAYSHLGLGDEFLTAQAEALAASGLVTEENLANVVSAQKSALELTQKSNDKRVADAQRKFQEEQNRKEAELKKQLDEAQKQLDELKKNPPHQDPQTPPAHNDDEMPAWYKKAQEAREAELAALRKQMEDLSGVNTSLKDNIAKMQKEKAEADKVRAAQERATFINAKAKELGIPEWRIAQGFSFSEDIDEAKITETLTGYANDIKTNLLPTKGHSAHVDPKEVSKEESASIAKAMVR